MKIEFDDTQEKVNPRRTYLVLSLYFIGFGILVAFLTSFVNFQMQVTNVEAALNERYERIKESKLDYLKISMASLDATLDSVAQSPTTLRYISKPSQQTLQALRDLVLATTVAEPDYMQVRLISDTGRELIRVDRDANGFIHILSEEELQDKSDRYYFKEGVTHLPNQHWYSKLDLNIEQGRIEMPIRPTLRVATPIKMNSGKNGLIVINVDVSNILLSLSASSDFTIYVKDKDGHILHHPSPNLAWSRYLPDREPLPSNHKHFFELSLEQLLNNQEGVKVVMVPKSETLAKITQNNLLTAGIIAGIVLIISFPLSWVIALLPARLQRKLTLALNQLQRTSNLLDKHLISSHSDKNGTIINASEQMCTISGYTRKELIGQNHSLFKHPHADSKTHDTLWVEISTGETWKGEFRNISKSGEEYWLRSIITPEYDEEKRLIGYMQIAQEITARKKLELLSTTDALTQIYNRHKLDQVLSDERGRYRRYGHVYSVIIIDLDYFKSINDTWGHQAGDDTLKTVAKTLQDTSRKVDFAGRWGGEEFLVICPNTELDGAYMLAEKLRLTISTLRFEQGFSVTASMGVATTQKDESINELLARADKSLYEAKLKGRNRVVKS